MHCFIYCCDDLHPKLCFWSVSDSYCYCVVWSECYFPFLILPFGLANVVSNTVMGGLGLPDIIGGFIVGIVTTSIIVFAKRRGCGNWIIWAAVTFVPGLGVPVWLSVLLDIPYLVLASSLLIGQCICGIASVMLVTALERVGAGKLFAFDGGKQ